MAYSFSSLCCFNQVLSWHKIMFQYPKMRSQSFRDNENSVDANMSVLRERIGRIRKRERLVDRCGWNYKNEVYGEKFERSSNHHQAFISEFAELMAITCGSIGLVFLTGSLCIFLVSLLVFISKN
ncbi:uncharacterized protein LOC114716874 [Neltuma alba]|uniref:uncharacterized protein LOC114716874 n=1 Tax=Neltuma alba TaxID=207710 RepID=UPI0010A54553|nr:uncharacterized protein LOC114716874 [Prosopis alba]